MIGFVVLGMRFGPNTLEHKSLGGSETAALMVAKKLAALGKHVVMFCNLPQKGEPDFFEAYQRHEDGVIYCPLESAVAFGNEFEFDCVVGLRIPKLIKDLRAKKKVCWLHDMPGDHLSGIQNMDEVWLVSEYQRNLVQAETQYNHSKNYTLRNGIVSVKTSPVKRIDNQLLYASRFERGLECLIKENGIMENLTNYQLLICSYDHQMPHLKDFYSWVDDRIEILPNVTFIGAKKQIELRQIIRESAACVYPTTFEDTSCILARECIEQQTPFLSTRCSVLPETLSSCEIFFESWIEENKLQKKLYASQGWCQQFATFIKARLSNHPLIFEKQEKMRTRKDLYWDEVAKDVEDRLNYLLQ